jgi:signal peptidase II
MRAGYDTAGHDTAGRAKRLPWLFLITAIVILLDRLSKNWVRGHIELGQAIPVIPRVFRITHVLNDGAAFSLFADSASPEHIRWGLIAFSSLAALAILVALVRMGTRFTLTTVSLALILGGALGNDYDRIRFASVVDFLEVHIFSYHWPDFNVADSAIVVGACLLMLDVLLPDKREKAAEQGRVETV